MLTSSNKQDGNREAGMAQAHFPDRVSVADKLATFAGEDKAALQLLMENARQDESLTAGIELYLDRASQSRFLHTLKLEAAGEWLGNHAPARLQIRLDEISRSSQHPAFQAFRTGLRRSGGLERAYPKSPT